MVLIINNLLFKESRINNNDKTLVYNFKTVKSFLIDGETEI